MLIFFSPCGLCSRSLCTSLCGGEKMYFLVYKVIWDRSIWGPCQFLMLAPNASWTFYLSICLETWNNLYIWKKFGKVKNLYGTCEGCLKKNEKLYGKMLNVTEQVKEFIWKNNEFVWTSERIYIFQRYSKYRFFDVNYILRYCKSLSIVFKVQFLGCPGKPKFQFHILCGWRTLYIYICVCCNVLGCSKCGGLHSWLITV